MWQHFVYLHKKADTGQVFYVGKGTARKQFHERAYTSEGRNKWWHRVVAKHGLKVEIIASCLTDQEAQRFERAMIAKYGRSRLVNLTDGGDGSCNPFISLATRVKRSLLAKRPRTRAWIDSMSASRKKTGNCGVVKPGDRLPESWRQAISRGQSGPNNYMRGRTGEKAPHRRRVINIGTGEIYPTVSIASDVVGMNMKTLYNMLSGHRQNRTALRFA
jgi:hypothetical protein